MFIVSSCRKLGGQNVPEAWGGINRLGDETDNVTVEVNNVLVEKRINNVFGVIEGLVDAGKVMREAVIRS